MDANAEAAFTLYAMSSPESYTSAASGGGTRTILTTDAENLTKGVEYEFDDRFANVTLIETASRFPFFGRMRDGGSWILSALQEYLTLSHLGKREREIADTLRAGILMPAEAPRISTF